MSHNFHIGVVKEVEAGVLTDKDIILYANSLQNIAAVKKTTNRVYVRFSYLSPPNKWDMSLTKAQKVTILGARRVTGMKG